MLSWSAVCLESYCFGIELLHGVPSASHIKSGLKLISHSHFFLPHQQFLLGRHENSGAAPRVDVYKRQDDILDELNLTIYKERHPMSLSGGQKQRTAIGVAALRDAEVLIFDEPTSGLDYKNMESVAGILSALSKRGKAILVISCLLYTSRCV